MAMGSDMRMRTLLFSVLFILLLLPWMPACTSDCTENKNALPLAGYYSSLDPITKRAYSGIEVIGIGAKGDSVLADASSREEVWLPFRIDSDTTAFLFSDAESGLSSEVTFIYSRTPRFVSEACGVSYIFRIKDIDVRGDLIDSVKCPQGYIDNANVENLKIYFYE